ncbi:MAG: alpha/beta fold hydrolase [Saprospiraceae bacterium]|nr:alpha/beta fold hydrolase [Saprospiraceae bacterium]
MPIIDKSTYKPPHYFRNTHLNTLYPAIFRAVKNVDLQRIRINTPDGDFFDADWSYAHNSDTPSQRLLVCIHGLEGHARRPYMAGMMKRFNTEGYDAVGLNMRGCSGEDNLLLASYHSGFTKDIAFFVDKIVAEKHYDEIVIVGFSVGGNIVLKYAGEKGKNISPKVKKVIAFSVPCDLESGSIEFEKPHNRFYQWQFLVTLKQKAKAKYKKFPGAFNIEEALKAKFFRQFDDHFTAPVNGFKDAIDYWHKASSLPYLSNICVPTLLVNATNDTFLGKTCFPIDVAEKSSHFYLEMPQSGGHLGFMSPDTEGYLWTENRAIDFVLRSI